MIFIELSIRKWQNTLSFQEHMEPSPGWFTYWTTNQTLLKVKKTEIISNLFSDHNDVSTGFSPEKFGGSDNLAETGGAVERTTSVESYTR